MCHRWLCALALCAMPLAVVGCVQSFEHPGGGGGNGGGGNGGGGNGGGGSGGGGGPGAPMGVPQDCPGGGTTTITGKVFAPNGTLPLYNAIVYIPSTAVAAFTDGVTCDTCNGKVSGSPLVTALTGPDGSFTLTNTTWGQHIPLVVQLGKWRVQSTIDSVTQCQTTTVDAGKTTLPSSRALGDLPKMAIATGQADPFECLLLKVGIDPKEIKPSGANSRIEFFTGANQPGTSMPGAQSATALTTSLPNLLKYDIVMLPCEGAEFPQSGTDNIVNYVNMGGRLFTTHFSYDWLTYSGSPFNVISKTKVNGLWDKDQSDYPNDDTTVTNAKLVTSFPKGKAFSQWLKNAGASSSQDTLDILQIRHDLDDVDPMYAQAWATDTMPDALPGIAHLTFNTPLNPVGGPDNGGPQYCGRVVFSDFHVAQSEADKNRPFPSACMSGPLTDQEKALAFMLFDLSSCVQPDQSAPMPIQ